MAKPWEQYAQAPAAKPWEQYAAPAPSASQQPDQFSTDPTEGMSRTERALAGAGRFFTEQGAGIYQAGVDAIRQPLEAVGGLYRGLGLQEGQNPLEAGVVGESERLQAEQTERERLGAPLRADPYGLGGEVAAGATTLLAPGIAARGTRVGGALLPRTITGNARQGAILGAVQPVGEDGSRTQNTLLGGAVGGAGAAVPAAVGAAYRGTRSILQPLTQRGQESIVGRLLEASAVNPGYLNTIAPSATQGVTRTLAEETADPGIAQLQRQFATQLAPQFAENTAARVGAVRQQFGGASREAVEGIESARDQAANSAIRELRLDTVPVDTAPVSASLDRIIAGQAGRPQVQAGLTQVRDLLAEPNMTADRLYNIRKTIGDLLGGRLGGDQAWAQAASRQLQLVRSQIDRQLNNLTRAFRPAVEAISLPGGAQAISVRTPAGEVLGIAQGDTIRIGSATVDPQFQGAGRGLDLYRKLIDEARKRGQTVTSDGSVSPEAARVYDALERRGYTVTRTPGSTVDPTGTILGPRGGAEPAFTISGGPNYREPVTFGDYLQNYRAESRRADQARVGQRLIEGPTGTRAIDPNTGEPVLTPSNLREGRNADRLVAQATGFPRARAQTTLTDPQRSLLTSLADDADRIAAAQQPQRGAAVGSMTADNLATRNILSSIAPQSRLGQLVAGSQPVQRLAQLGERTYGLLGVPQRLQELTAEALGNPARARQIIAQLPGPDQALVIQALTRAGGAAGQLAAVGQ
jgi:hypothetical protein